MFLKLIRNLDQAEKKLKTQQLGEITVFFAVGVLLYHQYNYAKVLYREYYCDA